MRQGAICAAARCGEALGVEAINSIIPILKSGNEDVKWRVRYEAINSIASLSNSLKVIIELTKSSDIFLKHFEPLFMTYLRDRAAAVRNLGIEKIPELFAVYKESWRKSLLTKLSEILEKDNTYYVKISAIYSLKVPLSLPRSSPYPARMSN